MKILAPEDQAAELYDNIFESIHWELFPDGKNYLKGEKNNHYETLIYSLSNNTIDEIIMFLENANFNNQYINHWHKTKLELTIIYNSIINESN